MSADASGQGQLLVGAPKLHGAIKSGAHGVRGECRLATAEAQRGLSHNPDLKELLDDVIPEHVGHQLVRRLQDFSKHHLPLGRSRPLQLLLDEPTRRSKEAQRKPEHVSAGRAHHAAEMQAGSPKAGMRRVGVFSFQVSST